MTRYNLPVIYNNLNFSQRREVRQQYVSEQAGLCYFCKSSLSKEPPTKVTNKQINWRLFPEGFLKHPIHLHHSHVTGLTLGAVHSYCNAVLWQYYGE